MELIKENKEKLRRVYKGANFYRKQWDFTNQEWLDDHIDIMEEVRPGYIINHGVEGGRMFIDTKIIEGTVANTLPHTPEFVKSIYDFCLQNINETQPFAHGDWVLSNIIVQGDSYELIDWDNVGVYQPNVVFDKLESDLRSAFGEKFDEMLRTLA
jgi:RIO-like serine/threonine protein kinase|tara:strand:+ start:5285 stop:5749 length:465 start_codon:yes stop_codon:yes gene_type:complete